LETPFPLASKRDKPAAAVGAVVAEEEEEEAAVVVVALPSTVWRSSRRQATPLNRLPTT
jgi:hypothetical protein